MPVAWGLSDEHIAARRPWPSLPWCLFVKQVLAAAVLAVMVTGGVAAGPADDGIAPFVKGDYATAPQPMRPKAEPMLGNVYDEGKGAPREFAEAVRWHRLDGGGG